ncbi:MAG: hypothetical protein ACTSU8_00175, partial [Alphaproteobacteria bacterium]
DPTVEVLVMQHLRTLSIAGEIEKALEFLENTTVLSPENRDVWGTNLKGLQTGFEELTQAQMTAATNFPFALAKSGKKELLFKWLTENVKLGYWGDFFTFLPEMRPYFGTPEFKNHMFELEMPPYWRETGWPDMCRPVGDNDFECSE